MKLIIDEICQEKKRKSGNGTSAEENEESTRDAQNFWVWVWVPQNILGFFAFWVWVLGFEFWDFGLYFTLGKIEFFRLNYNQFFSSSPAAS